MSVEVSSKAIYNRDEPEEKKCQNANKRLVGVQRNIEMEIKDSTEVNLNKINQTKHKGHLELSRSHHDDRGTPEQDTT